MAGPAGIEPALKVLETSVLPLYDGPVWCLVVGIVAKAPLFCKNGNVKKRIPVSRCEVCSKLGRHQYADLLKGESLPPEALRLAPDTLHTVLYKKVVTCPVCGRTYFQTKEVGFMEDDVEITRATPTEVGDELSEEDLANFYEDLNLTDDEDVFYAAECLTEFYLAKKNYEKFAELLHHNDPRVRLTAVVNGLAQKEKRPIIPLYEDVVKTDADENVRSNAIRLFSYNLNIQAHALDFLASLLDEKNKTVRYEAATALDYFARNKSAQAVEEALKKKGLTLARVAKTLKDILDSI